MKDIGWLVSVVATIFGMLSPLAHGQQQQFAELGSCALVSGDTLIDCRVGYRTLGTLSADRSNAILMPTWAGGTSQQAMTGFAGAGGMLDKSKYFLIFVDSLANGISSSPSNSKTQPRMTFPKITISDMVNVEHTLITKTLGISHLYAVVGMSMGAMQTFQWIVSYPDLMEKAVTIIGSPRLGAYDLVMWQTQIDLIKRNVAWNGGNYDSNPMGALESEFGMLILQSPDAVNRQTSRADVSTAIAAGAKSNRMDANDTIRQSEAMMALDVSQPFGGSMEAAAKRVKAKVLILVDKYDHTVTPGSAIAFAKLIHAPSEVFESDCGHLFLSCDASVATARVKEFLQ